MRKKKYYFGKNKIGKCNVYYVKAYPRALQQWAVLNTRLIVAIRSLQERLRSTRLKPEERILLQSLLEITVEAKQSSSFDAMQSAFTHYWENDPMQIYRRKIRAMIGGTTRSVIKV